MSTKLYDAWRMPVMPMAKFQKWIDHLRETFKPMADDMLLTEMTRRAVHDYDSRCVFPNAEGHKEERNVLLHAWSDVRCEYRKIKKDSERNPSVDAECEIIFAFKGRYIYMVVFSEVQKYKDYIANLPGVEHYGYWNNTDRPDNITQREWRRREKIWDDIFKSSFMFKGGVTWMLLGEMDLPIPHLVDINKYITSWEVRVKNMVRDAVYQEYPREITQGRDVMAAMYWLKDNPEAQRLKKEFRPKVEKLMKKDLTAADLNT